MDPLERNRRAVQVEHRHQFYSFISLSRRSFASLTMSPTAFLVYGNGSQMRLIETLALPDRLPKNYPNKL